MKGLDTVNEVDGLMGVQCNGYTSVHSSGNAMFAIFLFDYFRLNAQNVCVIL